MKSDGTENCSVDGPAINRVKRDARFHAISRSRRSCLCGCRKCSDTKEIKLAGCQRTTQVLAG